MTMQIQRYTRLIQPALLAGIFGVRRRSFDRLVEKLSDLEFITRSVETDSKAGTCEIKLQILDEDLLCHLLNGEALRFFQAAILSHSRSEQNEPRNFAWQAVEHYYSAYYSIHYLARMLGRSLSSLNSESVRAIKNNIFHSSAQTIPEGLYQLRYDSNEKLLTLNKKKKTGGSHKDAWAIWETIINEMILVCKSDDVEYAAEEVLLKAHKQFVLRAEGYFRPPEIRGEINYQFRGGCWRFEKNSEKSIRLLQGGLKTLESPGSSLSSVDLDALLRNNEFIFSLAQEVFKTSAKDHPRSIARAVLNEYSDLLT